MGAVIPPLRRDPGNPILGPTDVGFARAAGAFNPAAAIDRASGRVVLLVRVYETERRRSCLALAVSRDGVVFDELRAAIGREAPYEEWGVEDARITCLEDEGRYAITYTGYSAAGPRVCLITTDDLLDPRRYRRHGPRIAGDNKNAVVFPRRVGGRYAILHRPMPRVVYAETARLEDEWPAGGDEVLGPAPGTWRSARVGAGAPPLATRLGWLLSFHGATTVPEGNVYSIGWCLLADGDPRRVLWVSERPALTPEARYERHEGPLPQVDMANFPRGVNVVFPEGLVERDGELLLYYGAADVAVALARVGLEPLCAGIEAELLGRTPTQDPGR